ncbi:hypothetical protein CEXT_223131 [Caerostris extrusa]|uniref:Uncharacterized protein n=1 Tax=Caerostris extrusa TaxID=172846 RepID=A0AAV4RTB3_CAEEX|nr:hypothetical protein CEXT_223131 [Caerostris extrusa]
MVQKRKSIVKINTPFSQVPNGIIGNSSHPASSGDDILKIHEHHSITKLPLTPSILKSFIAYRIERNKACKIDSLLDKTPSSLQVFCNSSLQHPPSIISPNV